MLETLLAGERPGGVELAQGAEPGSPELWGGMTVLDLYAGTGALGIEALSRGAEWCDLVEANAAARRVIQRNLEATDLVSHARIIGTTVEKVIHGAVDHSLRLPYDLVVMDPPYADPRVGDIVAGLATGRLLVPGALVAVEHSRRASLAEQYDGLTLARERRHGDTVVSIFRWRI